MHKNHKKVILSIFFLIIIVRLQDKYLRDVTCVRTGSLNANLETLIDPNNGGPEHQNLVFCHRQETALIFVCVLIRHNMGAFISAVIFKDDILALQPSLLF